MKSRLTRILLLTIALLAQRASSTLSAHSAFSAHSAEPTKQSIENQPFDADLYTTANSAKKLGVLVLGGAEGGKPSPLAQPIAEAGYPTVALAYFKTKSTPEALDEIPLEYFAPVLNYMQANPSMSAGIVAVGASKGAELALLLATIHPEIHGVVARAPSFVVWQGLPKFFWPPRSSWTLNSQPLPFVPYDITHGLNTNHLALMYQQSLKQTESVEQASLAVEKINGPILLLSGQDDTLWPSSTMGDAICDRLKTNNFCYAFQHIKYENAGHTMNEADHLGGTTAGNQTARANSLQKTLDFLPTCEQHSAIAARQSNAPR